MFRVNGSKILGFYAHNLGMWVVGWISHAWSLEVFMSVLSSVCNRLGGGQVNGGSGDSCWRLPMILVVRLRARLVHVFKKWKLLFENICENTCEWKSVWECVKCCLKTKNCYLKIQTKHPLNILVQWAWLEGPWCWMMEFWTIKHLCLMSGAFGSEDPWCLVMYMSYEEFWLLRVFWSLY